MTLYSATMTLILVMDPLGNVPLFLSVLNNVNPKRRQLIILRETFIAFLILSFFLFFGKFILEGMHISEPALQIAGGIILFLIAIRMIFPQNGQEDKSPLADEPLIVPLAVPLIAGPSTMTMVMLLANQAPYDLPRWFVALTIAWFITTVILVFADVLRKILGERGLTAIERLMGMILTTMAVQMFLSGLEQFLHV
ncbi:MAG: NAAT family transporter [Gammaproteobacteria bacterium]|nr:NAAT family transporter [Gammaproteobacteria bacterium]MCW5582588.1 NAAT family transporter [Gammaproteobacteria bacterium]